MNRTELLCRVAGGAQLRIARNPWGDKLDTVVLYEHAVPGGTQFIHKWQIRRLIDAGLLCRVCGKNDADVDYVLTDAGRSTAKRLSAKA